MKKVFYITSVILIISFSGKTFAQEGKSAFDFLKLPYSARASAMGGTNISVIENDPSLVFQNPGFLGPEMNMGFNVNYLMYIADISAASAIFTKAAGERGAWGLGFNYLNYGNITETTEENIILGDMGLKDIAINAFYAHDITDRIRGGITGKFISSSYGEYTSVGIGVDLGLTYYNSDKGFSLGLAAKNLGGQLSAYVEERSPMPWDIQLGMSKLLSHAPVRFSITATRLNNWESYNLQGEKDLFMKNFIKHFIFGVDLIPSDNLWLAVGYNVKTGSDMALEQGNKLGGFSGGAGIHISSFEVSAAVAKYHPAATSVMISITNFFGK